MAATDHEVVLQTCHCPSATRVTAIACPLGQDAKGFVSIGVSFQESLDLKALPATPTSAAGP